MLREIITPVISYATLFSHLVFFVLLIALVSRNSWGKGLITFIGRNALVFSLVTVLSAIVGSLLYSGFVGYEPCELCWWQRIFIYPQFVLFAMALYHKDESVFRYSVPLSILVFITALYHTYIQLGGTTSILPCTSEGAACAKVFVNEFSYITIPTMALTISVYLLLIALINRIYQRI
ncbi:MAG: disulfide bond formation protein DsbB [Parcubacteria bacterium C7867-005]|nr:MAG: disulfide bond formation protein DsbB [Parcubacteria bacterium C7867-005]